MKSVLYGLTWDVALWLIFNNTTPTMATLAREKIEFKTLSGVTLRGWLYPSEKRGPGIILSAGVSIYIGIATRTYIRSDSISHSSTCLRM